MSHKSEMAGPLNRGDTIINKHFTLLLYIVGAPKNCIIQWAPITNVYTDPWIRQYTQYTFKLIFMLKRLGL